MLKPSQLCLITVVAFGAATCQAAPVVALSSTFDTGTEGWSIGAFFATESEPATDYQPTGGWSGGFLQTEDLFGNNAFRAPSTWLGNQAMLFGGTLRFYQRAADNDGLVAPAVALASGGLRLQYRAAPPGTDWTEYTVGLRTGDWEIADGSGAPGSRLATDAEILQVLSDLEWIAFGADWHTGDDLVGLDEVSITTGGGGDNPGPGGDNVPEPSAMTAFAGLGALALALLKRRRK
jgi:hypothetical protein